MDQKNRIFKLTARYLGGILLFAGGALLCQAEAYRFSFILFFLLGLLECALIFAESKRIFDLRILLSASWCFGIGLTALKLTNLSSSFAVRTWFVLGGFYFAFLFAYDLLSLILMKIGKVERDGETETCEASGNGVDEKKYTGRLFCSILIVTGLSIAGFLLEAIKFDFQFPVFVSGKPHAYTDFHISGVHYFVVTSVFVPALTTLYLMKERPNKRHALLLVFANLIALAVPVLLLSKLYLILFFIFPFLVFALFREKADRKKLYLIAVGILALGAVAFFFLIGRRQYPTEYLESVFQFKDRSVPVVLQYPYVYITNNFENLNLLVQSGDAPTLGLRSLFPFFALTGLKFQPVIASVINFPPYTTVEELTTVTIVYDAFGDFGSVGTVIFGMVLGVLSFVLSRRLAREKRVFSVLLYMEIAVYFSLSFFTTWFSHPTTWFWFAATLAIGLFCKEKGKSIW